MSIPRRDRPIRIFPLGGEPSDDLSATTTAEERLGMVTVLSEQGSKAPTWSSNWGCHPTASIF